MKKAVFKLNLYCDKTMQKAMKTVAGFSGVTSIFIDYEDQKLTVAGDIDPLNLGIRLRKLCDTELVSVVTSK